jgi:hypothetical protein
MYLGGSRMVVRREVHTYCRSSFWRESIVIDAKSSYPIV